MPLVSTRGASSASAFGAFIEIKSLPAPPDIGEYIHGGFYFGRIKIDNEVYNLVVSPYNPGQYTGTWSDINGTVPAPNSVNDGYKNTYHDTSVSHPSVDWVKTLTIDGYDDWYIPARDEMELLYRNLKPTTDDNYLGNQPQYPGEGILYAGENPNSVPRGHPYTPVLPAQTTVGIFKNGAQQALSSASDGNSMGNSTAYASLNIGYTVLNNGQQVSGSNRFDYTKRAIRRVKVGFSPAIGDAYGGGYFVGVIKIGTDSYNLIVSKKSEGSATYQYFDNGTPLPADVATSLNDGWTNTNKNNKAHYPACQWARSVFASGNNDWYIPSRDELELFYRNLKSTTTPNSTAVRPANLPDTVASVMGENPNSVPPYPGYTTTNPAQTTFGSFQTGGSEAEAPTTFLWSSSTLGNSSIYQRTQYNGTGDQLTTTVNTSIGVRLFRRERIS